MTKHLENLTAEQCREKASECAERAYESFERCDTDGFVSQWADGLNSRLYKTQAEIVENGGKSEFWGLFDRQGNRVRAKLINGRFGPCWALLAAGSDRFSGKFVPFCEAAGDLFYVLGQQADDPNYSAELVPGLRKRVAKWTAKHGYIQEREEAPAVAKLVGKGTGLSGSCWVSVVRTDGL